MPGRVVPSNRDVLLPERAWLNNSLVGRHSVCRSESAVEAAMLVREVLLQCPRNVRRVSALALDEVGAVRVHRPHEVPKRGPGGSVYPLQPIRSLNHPTRAPHQLGLYPTGRAREGLVAEHAPAQEALVRDDLSEKPIRRDCESAMYCTALACNAGRRCWPRSTARRNTSSVTGSSNRALAVTMLMAGSPMASHRRPGSTRFCSLTFENIGWPGSAFRTSRAQMD